MSSEKSSESPREGYNRFYSKRDFKHFRLADSHLIKSVIGKFMIPASSRFLDVGCGKGKYTKYFNDYGINAIGVDISDVAVDLASKNYPECKFICADMTKSGVFENESFDGILCAGYSPFSMELETIRPHIKLLVDYLKRGGFFILVMTTNLSEDKPREGASRTNYRVENYLNFFRGFDNLEVIGAYTLQPHLFIIFQKNAFNVVLSNICRYVTLITGLPLRTYIILRKT
jgi:SAM-dependent methyltransferase